MTISNLDYIHHRAPTFEVRLTRLAPTHQHTPLPSPPQYPSLLTLLTRLRNLRSTSSKTTNTTKKNMLFCGSYHRIFKAPAEEAYECVDCGWNHRNPDFAVGPRGKESERSYFEE